MRKFLLATALTLLAAPAFAATNWTIDPAVSKLTWTATFNQQPVSGQFDKWTGIIVFDPDHLETSSLAISVDLASVNSNDANRDGTLKGPDFFNTASTPSATFTSSRIIKTSQGYVAAGNLSLAGVTKPLAVPFTLNINGPKATANGQIQLSRGAFGVGKGQWKLAAGIAALSVGNPPSDPVNGIGDRVQVNFFVAANAAAAPAIANAAAPATIASGPLSSTAKDVNNR